MYTNPVKSCKTTHAMNLLHQIAETLLAKGPDAEGWHTSLCPFHDDHHPSLRLNEHGFRCMACNEKGGMKKLADKLGNEPFLDTTSPFAGFLIPLFAWLARQDSIRKGKTVRLGMDKAIANGKAVGRPTVVTSVDIDLVARLRSEGMSWREIAGQHPPVKSANGRKVQPSTGSIRRAYQACQKGSQISVSAPGQFVDVSQGVPCGKDVGTPS